MEVQMRWEEERLLFYRHMWSDQTDSLNELDNADCKRGGRLSRVGMRKTTREERGRNKEVGKSYF